MRRGPDGDGYAPDGDGYAPDGDGYASDGDGYASDGDGYAPGRHPSREVRDRRGFLPMFDAPAASGSPAPMERHPLLDRSLPADPDPEAEAWALMGGLSRAFWPALHACRGSRLALVRLSLSAPKGIDLRAATVALVAWVAARPGEGVFLAIDVRPTDGAEHLYGLVLTCDAGALVKGWCSLTDADPASQRRKTVTGWRQHMRGESRDLLPHAAHVLGYAVRPWPARWGWRDLERDVFACGTLADAWRDALAAGRGEGRGAPSNARKASPMASEATRKCRRCGTWISPDKRSDAIHCSDLCRKAANRDRRRAEQHRAA
jgi:hypothetical protein